VAALLALAGFALRRLWSQRALAAFLALGLLAAVALAVAVPLYAEGVNNRLLTHSLDEAAAQSRQPAFTFLFRYVGAWHGPLGTEHYAPLDLYLRNQAARDIGLPGQATTRYASTANLALHRMEADGARGRELGQVRLAFLSDLHEHIRLADGTLPGEHGAGGEALEVLVSLAFANEVGLQAGQALVLALPARGPEPERDLAVTISGVWVPAEAGDAWWFFAPDAFERRLFVSEQVFFDTTAGMAERPINDAVWRLSYDGHGFGSGRVPGLLAGAGRVQNRVSALLPNTTLDVSPLAALNSYQQQAQTLTGAFFIFSAPVLGLVLYFIGLAAGMLVRRQRSEIAVLRSRGASRAWIGLVHLFEWSVLALFGLLAGPWLGQHMAAWVGRTRAFLDFSLASADLPVLLTPGSLGLGAAAAGLAIAAGLMPATRAGRFTIVAWQRERAGSSARPLWQRAGLDVMLLLAAGYGLYTLRQATGPGAWRVLGRMLDRSSPYDDPLLFLLPAVFVVGSSLLVLRLLPLLLGLLAWLAALAPWTAPVLAARHLARSAGAQTGPLVLLLVTLSLAGFTASMARSLDRYLNDSVYYDIGADLYLNESGEFTGAPGSAGGLLPTAATGQAPSWNFLPISEHLSLPGVQAAARLGHYTAELQAGGGRARGRLFGVDRTDFPAVAYFRSDFAAEPLVALMNRLAIDPAALLLDAATWARLHLSAGDVVTVRVTASGESRSLDFRAAGVLNHFPMYYAADGSLLVANLEYVFEAFEGVVPYDVMVRLEPNADVGAVIAGLRDRRVAVIRAQDARAVLDEAYAAPRRQGMLGLLSIGFLSAAGLTAAGFALHTWISFRERAISLGVLRAIGLSSRQVAAALGLEQFVLILVGLAAGAGTALLASWLFIPYLPVSAGRQPGTPPFLVEIAWDDLWRVCGLFAALLAAAGLGTYAALRRANLPEAIKLGESL
jgi:putative ABC transport system permease protein